MIFCEHRGGTPGRSVQILSPIYVLFIMVYYSRCQGFHFKDTPRLLLLLLPNHDYHHDDYHHYEGFDNTSNNGVVLKQLSANTARLTTRSMYIKIEVKTETQIFG